MAVFTTSERLEFSSAAAMSVLWVITSEAVSAPNSTILFIISFWLSSSTPVSLPASTIMRISSSVTVSLPASGTPANFSPADVISDDKAEAGFSTAVSVFIARQWRRANFSAFFLTSCFGIVSVNAEITSHSGIMITRRAPRAARKAAAYGLFSRRPLIISEKRL